MSRDASGWYQCGVCGATARKIARHYRKVHPKVIVPRHFQAVDAPVCAKAPKHHKPGKKNQIRAIRGKPGTKLVRGIRSSRTARGSRDNRDWLDKVRSPMIRNEDCLEQLRTLGGTWHSGGQ